MSENIERTADSELSLTLEDFKSQQLEKLVNSEKFARHVKENFDFARKAAEKRIKETDDYEALYQNEKATDFFAWAGDTEAEKRLFKSGVVSQKVHRRASMMANEQERAYINPEFFENTDAAFVEMGNNGRTPKEMVDKIVEAGGPKGFLNFVLDTDFDYWWERHNLESIKYIAFKQSLIRSKSWVKLWDDGVKNIYISNVPFQDVFEDPFAYLPEERRFLFFQKRLHTGEIERRFGLRRHSIKAEARESERDQLRESETDLPDNQKYKTPRARLVEGYMREDATHEEEPAFPNGILVKFVCGQDEKDGIRLLSVDEWPDPEWPLIDYIPEPETPTRGKPIVRDLASVQLNADRIMQQTLNNHEVAGNARFFYLLGNEDVANKVKGGVMEKVGVKTLTGQQFIPPINVAGEGITLYGVLNSIGDSISGIHEVAEGRRPGNIESGRAMIVLKESVHEGIRPSVRFSRAFIRRITVVWVNMRLRLSKPGDIVKYGEGFKSQIKLPFALSAFIPTADIFISEDTTLPKDKQTRANLFIEFANMKAEDGLPYVTREAVLDALDIEDKPKLLRQIATAKQEIMQVQQMQGALKQAQQQMGDMRGQIMKLGEENQQMRMAMQSGLYKAEQDMGREKLKADASIQRIDMSNQTKVITEGIKAAVQERKAKQRGSSGNRKANPQK